MDVQYGWKCPQCNTVYAPSQRNCPSCSPTIKVTGSAVTGYAGTITLGNVSYSGFGTMFYSPPKSESVRAREAVNKWHEGGNSIKVLIDAAITALVDEACEEDEDDEDDA